MRREKVCRWNERKSEREKEMRCVVEMDETGEGGGGGVE
jgi:hypothetical protein